MSDESEIAGAAGAIGGGALALLIGALARAWSTVMGTRRERAEASVMESDAAGRLVGVATEIAEHAADDTRRVRVERDDCHERLAAMDVRMRMMSADISELRRGHEECEERGRRLSDEIALARSLLTDLLRGVSTPPSGLYVPDDVRAAMAAEETSHG